MLQFGSGAALHMSQHSDRFGLFAFLGALTWLACLTLVASLLGCSQAANGSAQSPLPGSSSLVLITVDTLRADRLPPYGYSHVETPWMSRLAADGVLFNRAIAQVPVTLPSHCSIMTGVNPGSTGVRDQVGFVLSDKHATLAERFKNAGYETAAFVASSVLAARTGLSRGFDVYSDPAKVREGSMAGPEGPERRADTVIREALDWIQASGRGRFFVWIHLYDPHAPYQPPEPYASRYKNDPYEGEIAYVDSALGNLLQSAIAQQWYDKSVIVLASDHGESLGEHGEQTHGFFVYDSTLRVPLIVKLPQSAWKNTRVPDQVRNIDIAPTMLELAGLERGADIEGESLLPRMTGKVSSGDLLAYSETYFPYYHFRWSPLLSLRTSHYEYISAHRPELYNLEADPGEKNNIAAQNSALSSRFSQKLSSMVQDAAPSLHEEYDSRLAKQLAGLGYVGLPRTQKSPPSMNLPDPKDKLAVYLLLQDAVKDGAEGRIDQSIRKLRQVLREDNHIFDAHLNLGVNYGEQGKFAEAAGSFEQAVAIDDRNVLANFNLGLAYARLGRWNAATSCFRRTLALNPQDGEAMVALGQAYQSQGKLIEAKEVFERAISQQPGSIAAHAYLAKVYKELGMLEKARVEALEAARLESRR